MKIGYARVSTRGQNLDLQLEALKNANCDSLFSEETSGKSASRPKLAKCLEILQKGDSLVVWKLDRLGRNLLELLKTVADLEARGVEIQSLSENIDTSATYGKMIFKIFSLVADYKADLIKERIQAARDSAKLRGAPFGRPRKLSVEDLEEAKLLRATGLSMSRIATFKNVSVMTLYRHGVQK
jgi:DNA invertase Pin-like site-specific DNA recombinase